MLIAASVVAIGVGAALALIRAGHILLAAALAVLLLLLGFAGLIVRLMWGVAKAPEFRE